MPHHCPHRINAEIAELICALRRQHRFWGARKLLRILATRHPRVTDWPAASTAADLLAHRVSPPPGSIDIDTSSAQYGQTAVV